MQTNFTAEQLRDPDTASSNSRAAHLRPLRHVHRDLPDLPAAGRRTRQPARPHLPDQGHAGDRPSRHRGSRPPRRSLPVLPVLHDHLPVRRELHAPGRSRPHLHRADLSPPAAGAPAALRARLAAAAPRPVPPGAYRRPPRPAAGRPHPRHLDAGAADACDAVDGAGVSARRAARPKSPRSIPPKARARPASRC